MASSGGTHSPPGHTAFLLLSGPGLGAVSTQTALDAIDTAELKRVEAVLVSF